jgi:hypothetical protein
MLQRASGLDGFLGMTKEMENRHEILNLKTDELKGQSH